MTEKEREQFKEVYVTIETVSYEIKASELPIKSMAKWLEQYLSGTIKPKPMKKGEATDHGKND
jgi:hypothetical protein